MITELERASLLLRFWNGEKTYLNAFKLSHPETTANDNSINALASRWKNNPEIKQFANDIINKFNATANGQKKGENGQKGENETTAENYINFRDLNEFLNYCETRANVITDERDRQKYLQMISELMRYKEHDTNDNEMQRFYTPLQCSKCPLYSNLYKEVAQKKGV